MDFPKSVPGVGLVNGAFVDENPLTGTPGSLIPAAWGNAATYELLNVIVAAGMTPSEADQTQLLQAVRYLAQTPGRLLNVRVITTSGTYIPTPGTNSIIVEALGGGGGGGGANAAGAGQVSAGGHGGGGAYAKGRFTSGFYGQSITIGNGGAGGGVAVAGGSTSLGGLIGASGGFGGAAGVGFTPPGSSGGATQGGINVVGGNIVTATGFIAQATVAVSATAIINVQGAPSQYGPGPSGGFGNGTTATIKGSGGTGALAGPSSGPFNGGPGAPGVMIIWEYT
ncbi:hypothetical protein [Pseudomonas sp. MG-9]|uniref:hypothetical protein n=1 Tax=Pseudomonas sp. MG-9 TaxID=2839032 RepID=UPI002078E815|nr:hypothetical protein [Pseudomonas sp. MG-9]